MSKKIIYYKSIRKTYIILIMKEISIDTDTDIDTYT